MPFSKYNMPIMVYDTEKSLENDIRAPKFDNDQSAPHFTLFQIEAKCTIMHPFIINFLSSLNFQNIIFKLRKNAQLSDLVLIFFSAVSTSITSFQIAAEWTIN